MNGMQMTKSRIADKVLTKGQRYYATKDKIYYVRAHSDGQQHVEMNREPATDNGNCIFCQYTSKILKNY